MTRFRALTELPLGALYSSCGITRGLVAPGERWVDLDFAVDNDTPNGDLIVRESLIREIAGMLGMVDRSAVTAAEDEVVAILDALAFAQEELAIATQVADSVLKFAPERESAPSALATTKGRRRPAKTRKPNTPGLVPVPTPEVP